MKRVRDIDFDLLRSIVMLSAFVIHFHSNINIGLLVLPSSHIQNYYFTVGGFFFFTAGYMARKVYLHRFVERPRQVSRKVFFKGFGILSLYLAYVFFMHIFTNTHLPKSPLAFIYEHRFFARVLFAFAILYMSGPIILLLFAKAPRLFIGLTVVLAILLVSYNQQWDIPYTLKKIFFDRELNLYPFFPSLFVYVVGFIIANFESENLKSLSSPKFALSVLLFFVLHYIFIKNFEWYAGIVTNRNWLTFLEAITPYLSIIIVRYLIQGKHINQYVSSAYVLCIGILSLHFYFISNLFLGLVDIPTGSKPFVKLLGFLGIGGLAYLFTFWRFRALTPAKENPPISLFS